MPKPRQECPDCGRTVSVNHDGNLRRHPCSPPEDLVVVARTPAQGGAVIRVLDRAGNVPPDPSGMPGTPYELPELEYRKCAASSCSREVAHNRYCPRHRALNNASISMG